VSLLGALPVSRTDPSSRTLKLEPDKRLEFGDLQRVRLRSLARSALTLFSHAAISSEIALVQIGDLVFHVGDAGLQFGARAISVRVREPSRAVQRSSVRPTSNSGDENSGFPRVYY